MPWNPPVLQRSVTDLQDFFNGQLSDNGVFAYVSLQDVTVLGVKHLQNTSIVLRCLFTLRMLLWEHGMLTF
jgi:hypothetical protein